VIARRIADSVALSSQRTLAPSDWTPSWAHNVPRSTLTGLSFIFAKKGLKDAHADCAVSDRERILEVPFRADVTTSVENAAQSVFQALRVVCLTANLNVR